MAPWWSLTTPPLLCLLISQTCAFFRRKETIKETIVNQLLVALTPRVLGVLLLVLLALLLTILLLGHAHVGVMPTYVQSTAAVLD